MEKESIVILGGSFNPPHNSHFSIAQQVLNQFEKVEKIIFIPVNDKYPKNGLLSNEHRRNMLKLVADKNSKFIISENSYNEKLFSYFLGNTERISSAQIHPKEKINKK